MYKAGRKILQQTDEGLIEQDMSPEDPRDHGGFEREDDWSSCAYFYVDTPENRLPELGSVEKRIIGLLEDPDAQKRMDG
jgi:hypothetical protein